jgi:hypothetical protein
MDVEGVAISDPVGLAASREDFILEQTDGKRATYENNEFMLRLFSNSAYQTHIIRRAA